MKVYQITNKISRWAIYIAALITPTTLGMLLPITFNTKYSAGGLMLLLSLVFFFRMNKVKYHKVHVYLLLFIFFNVIYFILSLFKNLDSLEKSFTIFSFLSLVTVCIVIFSVFIFYNVIITSGVDILFIPWLIAIGGLINTTFAYLMYYFISKVFDIDSSYQFREYFYEATRDTKITENLASFSLVERIPFQYFEVMGGTAAIGPFLSFIGMFCLFYFILSKQKLNHIPFFIIAIFSFLTSTIMASRSAIVSPILAVLVFFAIISYTRNPKNFFVTASFLMFSLVSLFAVAVGMSESVTFLSKFSFDALTSEPRLQLWWQSIILSILNPLGYGYNYIGFMNNVSHNAFPFDLVFKYNHPHSVYLTTLLEFGFAGLLLLLVVFHKLLRIGVSNYLFYKGTKMFPLAGATLVALITSLFQFIFGTLFIRHDAIYGGTFWLVISLILILDYKRKSCFNEKK